MPQTRVASRILIPAALLLASVALLPASGVGQSPESPLLRGGQLRFEIFPEIRIYDDRYGLRADGSTTIEEVEPLGVDFARTAVDAQFLPSLTPAQASLALLLDDPSFAANLGSSQARVTAGLTEIPIGIGLGLTDWLTIGGRVPFVRQRVDVDFAIDQSTANVGTSPGSGSANVQSFLGQFAAVISATSNEVDATCAALGDSDPACTQGRITISNANALLQAFQDAYAELVFPLSGSSAAAILEQRVSAITRELGQVGDSALVDATLTEPIPWATGALGDQAIESLFTDPALGVGVTAPGSYYSIWELGDVEVSAAIRLLNLGADPDRSADPVGAPEASDELPPDSLVSEEPSASRNGNPTTFVLGIGGTYRLGTGLSDLPDNLFDLGTGDGQDDVEIHAFARLDLGGRFRARADARYGLQLEGTAIRRISGPDDPIAPLTSRQEVRWNPGEYLDVQVVPEFRLAPELSLGLRYRYYSKGADAYAYSVTGDTLTTELPPVELLDEETEVTVQHVGVGATLWPSRRTSLGGQWPLAVSAEYLAPISGSGGRTPKDGRFRVAARLFISLW
jgi:hypothetical protein